MTALIGIAAFAGLFIVFGMLRRRGEEATGCGACGGPAAGRCGDCAANIEVLKSSDATP